MNEIDFYNGLSSDIAKELDRKILNDLERSSSDRISTGIKIIDKMSEISPGTLSKILPRWASIDKIIKDGVPTEFTYITIENSVEDALETVYRGANTSAIYYDDIEYGHHPPKNNLKATFEHNGQTILSVESKAAGTFPSEEEVQKLVKDGEDMKRNTGIIHLNRAQRRAQEKKQKMKNKGR